MIKHILLTSSLLLLKFSFSQELNTSDFNKWAISAHLGVNTTSTNSSNASFLSYNWSLGVLRNIETEKAVFSHHVKVKAQVFNEKLENLPFYELDSDNNLVSSTYTSKGMHSMIYLGWGIGYTLPFKSQAFLLKADLGFNYLLPSRYTSSYSNGNAKGSQSYRRPNNFFFARPEVSVGFGYKLNLGSNELIIAPFYSYNFTIQFLNLVPSFHTVGLETTFNF